MKITINTTTKTVSVEEAVSLIEERDQLKDRHTKLRNFLVTDTFKGLSRDEKDDMIRQSSIMGHYLMLLERRIARFTAAG